MSCTSLSSERTMNKARVLVSQGMLAAVYVALTLLLQPISFGPLQCRVAEALTVLPYLEPMCVVGLTVGCLFANLLGGAGILDIIFGTLATFLAAMLTAKMRNKWLAPLPPIVINAVIVGAVLTLVNVPLETFFPTFWIFAGQVGLGQIAACAVLGLPLLAVISYTNLFPKQDK